MASYRSKQKVTDNYVKKKEFEHEKWELKKEVLYLFE